MQASEISKFSMVYQRNGVGGAGGFWATFEAPDDAGETRRFAGHLWHECREPGIVRGGCPEECNREEPNEAMVILIGELVGMSNGGDTREVGAWRSTDYFLPALLPHFRIAYHDWMAEAFSPEFAAKFFPVTV